MLKRAQLERKRIQQERDALYVAECKAIRIAGLSKQDDLDLQHAEIQHTVELFHDIRKTLSTLKESVEELGNNLVSQITEWIGQHRSLWNIVNFSADAREVWIAREEMEPLRRDIIKVHEQARVNGCRFAEIDGMFAVWKAEDERRTK